GSGAHPAAETGGARRALLIATALYEDARLDGLRAPENDAEALASVLLDPAIGGYQVEVVSNESEAELRRRLDRFFSRASRDDVLLLHLACHGIRSPDNRLYFAARDTDKDSLDSTAVPGYFLTRLLHTSPSRRKVVLLDCCY